MVGAAVPGRLSATAWQQATVVDMRPETATARTVVLRPEDPFSHVAGQHVVVRLTAPDGYRASRSYSIASAPSSELLELTVERLDGGEVSPFLHDELEMGDQLEVRGPIGRWFTWTGSSPAVLVGGGSGVVPLMSMLRLARELGRADLVRMVLSVRSLDDLYYRDELPGPEACVIYTRSAPADATRDVGRLDREDLVGHLLPGATAYVCGAPGFADAATDHLVSAGVPVECIRVERYGPS